MYDNSLFDVTAVEAGLLTVRSLKITCQISFDILMLSCVYFH